MRRLGIIGGMSWESTTLYYQAINQGVKNRLGGLHSADLLLHSLDFQPIEALQVAGDWAAAGECLAQSAKSLERAGAEGLIIATNTMHLVYEQVAQAVSIPVLHIADCTGQKLHELQVTTVGLMATAFTMEQPFYKNRLAESWGLDVIVPAAKDRADVHRIIYEELCLGRVETDSQARYVEIAESLAAQGAESVIMGCTEIGMLLNPSVCRAPLIDTMAVHAEAAVDWMLETHNL